MSETPPTDPAAGPWRVSVAPMIDWTDRHCRFFHRQITRRALLYTEMVNAGGIVHGGTERHLRFNWAAVSPSGWPRPRAWASNGATTRST